VKRIPWTAEEIALVRRLYPRRRGVAATRAALPGRTPTAVRERARVLGVHNRPRWSAREDQILRIEWHELTPDKLRRKLPCRTWTAIRGRAYVVLGLPLGIPQGHEAIFAAAVRLGVSYWTLRRILAWAEVRVRRAYGGDGSVQARTGPARYVDSDEATDALRRWLRTETLVYAATRLGLDKSRLRHAATALGLLPPKCPGRRPHLRLDPDQWDAAARRCGGRPRQVAA
jgi:hypothetical protein